MSNRLRTLAVTAAALALPLASTAFAAPISVVAQGSWDGESSVNVDGVIVSAFESNTPMTAGRIGIKMIPVPGPDLPGAGVRGQWNNEIDAFGQGSSEVLRFEFGASGSVINDLILGLLFDGPEYGDWEEVARFNVTFADASTGVFTLRTNWDSNTTTSSTWDGSGTWSSDAVWNGGAGRWSNANPFGGRAVRTLDMLAVQSTSCWNNDNRSCSDQSDYVFRSLQATAVPEPGTLALLGLGLAGLGLARRKGRAAH